MGVGLEKPNVGPPLSSASSGVLGGLFSRWYPNFDIIDPFDPLIVPCCWPNCVRDFKSEFARRS